METQTAQRKKSKPINPNMDLAREKSLAVRKDAMRALYNMPLLVAENRLLRELLIKSGLADKLPSAIDIIQHPGS